MAFKKIYNSLITIPLAVFLLMSIYTANGQSKHPGYGNLIFKYSWVDDVSIPLYGFEGGIYLHQRYPIGLNAEWSENLNNFLFNVIDSQFYDLKFRYINITGGLIGKDHDNAVRIGAHLSAGLGHTTFSTDGNSVSKSSLILEPSIRLYHRLARNFTIGAGGSYRWSSISNQKDQFSANINGFAIDVLLRFGIF